MAEKDSVRGRIIAAAKKRFSHFGCAKTELTLPKLEREPDGMPALIPDGVRRKAARP